MNYVSAINNKNELQILDASNKVVLSIRHRNTIETGRCKSELFDTEDDLISFVEEQKKFCNNSHYMFFQIRAYEIVNEHFINLYYEIIASNS